VVCVTEHQLIKLNNVINKLTTCNLQRYDSEWWEHMTKAKLGSGFVPKEILEI